MFRRLFATFQWMQIFLLITGAFLPITASNSFKYTLSPARVVLTGSGTQRFLFYNYNDAAITVNVSAQPNSPYSAIPWLAWSPTSFTVDPHSFNTALLTVKVPDDAEAGDHSAWLMFSVPSESVGTIRITRSLAATVVVTGRGAAIHGLTFSDLRVPALVDSETGPVALQFKATATGNIHETLSDAVGRVSSGKLTIDHLTILRGSHAIVRARWAVPTVCWACQIRVGTLTAQTWVAPFRGLLGGLLSVVGLAVVVSYLRRRISITIHK